MVSRTFSTRRWRLDRTSGAAMAKRGAFGAAVVLEETSWTSLRLIRVAIQICYKSSLMLYGVPVLPAT